MNSTRVLAALAAAVLLGAGITACDSSGGGSRTHGSSSPPAGVPSAGPTIVESSRPSSPATSRPAPARTTGTSGGSRPPSPSAPPGATRQVVIRPVTSAGAVVGGWTVRDENSVVDCSGGLRSPVSTSDDVLFCAPSAASATACWHAADRSRVLCLPDPRVRTLVRYRLNASAFPAARPVEVPPAPASLDLVDGTRCDIRDGGAAARLAVHPDWVPYYFCGSGASRAVWAEPDSADGGVIRGDGMWQVQVGAGDGTGALHPVGVASAYFVGTA